MQTNVYDVIIIGGGASGMMASIFAARNGFNCLVLDHNEKLGKKLYITGKGRCNLTNNSSIENHLNHIVNNSKFMYSALNAFSPQSTIEFFEKAGLKLKTEQGNRVFPKSDKSSDVIKTLTNLMQNYGVEIKLNCEVESVTKENQQFKIKCNKNIKYTANSVIIATGGLSYSSTGASAIGYNIAKNFGHNIIETKPALCPIVVKEDITKLNGLSLKNVNLTVSANNKNFNEFGEMLFTYNSLTGPIALKLSSLINRLNLSKAIISIDFKPALSQQTLNEKFLREFKEYPNKELKTYLATLLPARLVEYFIEKTKLINKKLAEITKQERTILINSLKKFDFSIKCLDNINVGIVTSGGVDVKQINSKTCMSKIVPNLYFVGEVLDIDAFTGGYNLQIAWSTGYLAGNSIT